MSIAHLADTCRESWHSRAALGMVCQRNESDGVLYKLPPKVDQWRFMTYKLTVLDIKALCFRDSLVAHHGIILFGVKRILLEKTPS